MPQMITKAVDAYLRSAEKATLENQIKIDRNPSPFWRNGAFLEQQFPAIEVRFQEFSRRLAKARIQAGMQP